MNPESGSKHSLERRLYVVEKSAHRLVQCRSTAILKPHRPYEWRSHRVTVTVCYIYHNFPYLVNVQCISMGLNGIRRFTQLHITHTNLADSEKYRSINVMGAILGPRDEQTASVGGLVDAVGNLAALSRLTSRRGLAAEITPAPCPCPDTQG